MTWFYVFVGGGLGAIARFGVSKIVLSLKADAIFPIATLLSNTLATILLAYLVFKLEASSQAQSFFWAVGFCGAFSTFSTFSLESFALWQGGHYLYFTANIILNLALGFFIMWMFSQKVI